MTNDTERPWTVAGLKLSEEIIDAVIKYDSTSWRNAHGHAYRDRLIKIVGENISKLTNTAVQKALADNAPKWDENRLRELAQIGRETLEEERRRLRNVNWGGDVRDMPDAYYRESDTQGHWLTDAGSQRIQEITDLLTVPEPPQATGGETK